MAICDICRQVMPGTHPSQQFLPGTPMPPGWKIASHGEVVHSRDLIKAALLVHLQPLGISSEQITDDHMKKWVEEMESRFGQTDWMLCPTCNGILDPSVQVQKPVDMSMQGPPAINKNKRRPSDQSSVSRSWTLLCPSCGKRYVVGEDSILVSDEDAMEFFFQAGGKAILGTQARKADLAINKGTLPPLERQKALENIQRIKQDLQQGRPRSWRCYHCSDNAYPAQSDESQKHTQSDSSPKRGWAERVKDLVENKARSTYPEHRADVNMIGIEPPHAAERHWAGAEEFVKGLEEHGSFDEICFRAFVGFLNAKTGQFEFAKHIEVKGGKAGDFFWPPREDWGSTPIIYALGQHVGRVTTP